MPEQPLPSQKMFFQVLVDNLDDQRLSAIFGDFQTNGETFTFVTNAMNAAMKASNFKGETAFKPLEYAKKTANTDNGRSFMTEVNAVLADVINFINNKFLAKLKEELAKTIFPTIYKLRSAFSAKDLINESFAKAFAWVCIDENESEMAELVKALADKNVLKLKINIENFLGTKAKQQRQQMLEAFRESDLVPSKEDLDERMSKKQEGDEGKTASINRRAKLIHSKLKTAGIDTKKLSLKEKRQIIDYINNGKMASIKRNAATNVFDNFTDIPSAAWANDKQKNALNALGKHLLQYYRNIKKDIVTETKTPKDAAVTLLKYLTKCKEALTDKNAGDSECTRLNNDINELTAKDYGNKNDLADYLTAPSYDSASVKVSTLSVDVDGSTIDFNTVFSSGLRIEDLKDLNCVAYIKNNKYDNGVTLLNTLNNGLALGVTTTGGDAAKDLYAALKTDYPRSALLFREKAKKYHADGIAEYGNDIPAGDTTKAKELNDAIVDILKKLGSSSISNIDTHEVENKINQELDKHKDDVFDGLTLPSTVFSPQGIRLLALFNELTPAKDLIDKIYSQLKGKAREHGGENGKEGKGGLDNVLFKFRNIEEMQEYCRKTNRTTGGDLEYLWQHDKNFEAIQTQIDDAVEQMLRDNITPMLAEQIAKTLQS